MQKHMHTSNCLDMTQEQYGTRENHKTNLVHPQAARSSTAHHIILAGVCEAQRAALALDHFLRNTSHFRVNGKLVLRQQAAATDGV